MKRKTAFILSAILAVALCFSAAACGSTKVTDRMDVQMLWKETTGQDGYPQACLVVKSDFAASSGGFIKEFADKLKAADGWAEKNTSQAVAAVAANMKEGAETTISSVTAEVVERCHIKAVSAADDRTAIEAYLGGFLAMEQETETSLIGGKLPDDGFYYTPAEGGQTPQSVSVYMPDGATALALSPLMHEGGKIGGAQVKYTVVPSSDIQNYVKSGEADLAVVPSNLAAKLYNANGKYKLVMSLTHGNLYIVGGDMEGAQSLVGKRVGVIGQGLVPDLVLRYILKQKNIEYVTSDKAVEGKVALSYYADGMGIVAALKAGKADFGLLAEPAASTVYDKIHE